MTCVEVTRGTSKCDDGGFKDERPTGKERENPASNQPPTLDQRNTRPQTQNSRLQGICLSSTYDSKSTFYLEELLCLEKEFVRGERRRRRAPRVSSSSPKHETKPNSRDRRHHWRSSSSRSTEHDLAESDLVLTCTHKRSLVEIQGGLRSTSKRCKKRNTGFVRD